MSFGSYICIVKKCCILQTPTNTHVICRFLSSLNSFRRPGSYPGAAGGTYLLQIILKLFASDFGPK